MLGSIIAVAVQLLGFFLKRAEIKGKLAEEYFAWAEKLGDDLGSSKLRDYVFTQQQWLKNNPWKETK